MSIRFLLGNSDFQDFRRGGAIYVDKSRLILDVIEDPAYVMLLPRPRRFGKTLNLSMLRYFFEKSGETRADLFSDLEVWRSETARAHFQRYPVVFISFKDVKKESWADAQGRLKELFRQLYDEHRDLLDQRLLEPYEAQRFQSILAGTGEMSIYTTALQYLVKTLARVHQQKVLVLVDEYDTPIHAAFLKGYYAEMIDFMRDLLDSVLKDNRDLFKGVVTGILRVAKENIFSGLNNLGVYTLVDARHSTSFGFTEAEVEALAERVGEPGLMSPLRDTYNGYLFGGLGTAPVAVYNPWSVLNCLADEAHMLKPWWVDSSSNDLVRELILRRGLGLSRDMEALLRGEEIERTVQENIVFPSLWNSAEYLWSLLLFSGYVKASQVWLDESHALKARLALPNREVRFLYERTFRDWLSAGTDMVRVERLSELTRAMFAGDAALLEEHLSAILLETLSTFDPGSRRVELLYQGFVVGLLVWLDAEYEVRSNPESGYGRADVLIRPRKPGRSGAVLELKVLKAGRTVEAALREALEQIDSRQYATSLKAAGISPVYCYAVVFDGKQAHVAVPGSLPSLPDSAGS